MEDKGTVIEQGNEKYYELLLKTKIPSTKEKIIEVSIKKQRKKIISIFKSVWKGESG